MTIAGLLVTRILTAPSLKEPFGACTYYCRVRTSTCVCGVLPQHILVPIGCEHLVVGLTRKEADTMTLRVTRTVKAPVLSECCCCSCHANTEHQQRCCGPDHF